MVILFMMYKTWLSPFVKQTDEDFLIETYLANHSCVFLFHFLLFLDYAFSLFIIIIIINNNNFDK